MPENDTRTMIATPIAALLKSRKTMIVLIGALINIGVGFAPGLEAYRAELLTIGLILTSVLGTVLIGSIGYEDGKEKSAPTTIITGSGDVAVTAPPAPPQVASTPENFNAPHPPTPPGHPY